VISLTPRPPYLRGKSARYPLVSKLGGPQGRSGRGGEETHHCSWWELNHGRPAHSLVSVLTEFLRLLVRYEYGPRRSEPCTALCITATATLGSHCLHRKEGIEGPTCCNTAQPQMGTVSQAPDFTVWHFKEMQSQICSSCVFGAVRTLMYSAASTTDTRSVFMSLSSRQRRLQYTSKSFLPIPRAHPSIAAVAHLSMTGTVVKMKYAARYKGGTSCLPGKPDPTLFCYLL